MPLHQEKVALTDRQWTWLRSEAARLGVTVPEILRRVLDAAIDGQPTQSRRKSPGAQQSPASPPVDDLEDRLVAMFGGDNPPQQ